MNPMLSKSTTEKYRAACNVPRRGRDGLLQSLYGYVCGNITTEREDLTAGKYDCKIFYEILRNPNREICKYGEKKRKYYYYNVFYVIHTVKSLLLIASWE
jgi:hypothetical protein